MRRTWRGREREGWNVAKTEGCFWRNAAAVTWRLKRGLRGEREERGSDFEGDDTIRSFRERSCLRFFSRWTASSRYGSQTHLTLALMKVRLCCRHLPSLVPVAAAAIRSSLKVFTFSAEKWILFIGLGWDL